MLKNKRVLVNGCSFSRGPESWPYQLQKSMDFDLTNLAVASAGNRYIHDTTISELAQRSYDFVVIMWSGLERVDIPVENIGEFNRCTTTSLVQSQRNDWPEKKIYPVNDQDLIEKNWVFVYPSQKQLTELQFAEFVKYQNYDIHRRQSLMHMVSLQGILKQQQIPYVFSFYMDYMQELEKQPDLYCLLDQTSICCQDNLYSIAQSYKLFEADGFHPNAQAHAQWAKLVEKFINEQY